MKGVCESGAKFGFSSWVGIIGVLTLLVSVVVLFFGSDWVSRVSSLQREVEELEVRVEEVSDRLDLSRDKLVDAKAIYDASQEDYRVLRDKFYSSLEEMNRARILYEDFIENQNPTSFNRDLAQSEPDEYLSFTQGDGAPIIQGVSGNVSYQYGKNEYIVRKVWGSVRFEFESDRFVEDFVDAHVRMGSEVSRPLTLSSDLYVSVEEGTYDVVYLTDKDGRYRDIKFLGVTVSGGEVAKLFVDDDMVRLRPR